MPDYEVEGALWRDRHYKGSYLLRETITVEATPATDDEGRESYGIRYGFDSRTPNRATKTAELTEAEGVYSCTIPLDSRTTPGFKGALELLAQPWQ